MESDASKLGNNIEYPLILTKFKTKLALFYNSYGQCAIQLSTMEFMMPRIMSTAKVWFDSVCIESQAFELLSQSAHKNCQKVQA